MREVLYRIQDKDGRGPFKPGVTSKWCDYNNPLPSIMEDFPMILERLKPYHVRGMHIGCAVKDSMLGKWFSDAEQKKLKKLGYKVVQVKDYEVVCESDHQVVFACKKPLRNLNNI